MAGLIIIGAMLLIFVLSGTWIAIALGATATFGLYQALGDRLFPLIGTLSWQGTTGFTLTAVPLFILMGDIFYYGGLAKRLYRGLFKLIRGLPGGLVQTNIISSTIFAACSGSSIASAAAFAPMAYEEEVKNRNYEPSLVLGSLAAGGTLGILIPPSIILILYGTATNQSIGKLFMAGLIPGLLMAGLFMIYIALRCKLNPHLSPAAPVYREKADLKAWNDVWPIGLIAIIVLGSIYGGVATPTEAAAIGALGTLLISLAYRELSWGKFRQICLSTASSTSMIFFITIAANAMASMLAYYDVPILMRDMGMNIGSRALLLAFVIVVYLILGMFFDGISILMITIPFFLPLVESAGFNLIWFGIMVVILIEVGLLTPPVGLNLFVVQGSTGADSMQVIRGCIPFILIQVLVIALLIVFPGLALWLPLH